MQEHTHHPDRVLLAVRLGWLTVEVFGRLRHYVAGSRKSQRQPGEATRRFDFSSRALSEHDALLLAMDQLRRTATGLSPGLPASPLPAPGELDHVELNALQGALDDWSTQVWVALSTEDDIVGRSFTYGGSLADTYWHATVLGPRRFAELLHPNRLEYMAHHFDGIANHLPPFTARVLHYTLYRWRGAYEYTKSQDSDGKRQVLKRLESQAGIWHYLLVGGRSAVDYLTADDRRFVTWLGAAVTTLFVAVVTILVWLAVLALSGAGRTAAASMIVEFPGPLSEAQVAIVSDLLDWRKWSALLATVSSITVLIAGLVTRLSGWVVALHNLVREWLTLRRIYRRTYRDWRV